jgi:hypothetical protein
MVRFPDLKTASAAAMSQSRRPALANGIFTRKTYQKSIFYAFDFKNKPKFWSTLGI